MAALADALFREVRPEFFRVLSGGLARLYLDALDALEVEASRRSQGLDREDALGLIEQAVEAHAAEWTESDTSPGGTPGGPAPVRTVREKALVVFDTLKRAGWLTEEENRSDYRQQVSFDAHGTVLLQALRKSRTAEADATREEPAPTSANYIARMAAHWQACPAPSLVLLSGDDLVAAEFRRLCSDNPHWKARLSHPRVTCIELPGADHTCSSAQHRARVEDETLAFVQSLEGVACKR